MIFREINSIDASHQLTIEFTSEEICEAVLRAKVDPSYCFRIAKREEKKELRSKEYIPINRNLRLFESLFALVEKQKMGKVAIK